MKKIQIKIIIKILIKSKKETIKLKSFKIIWNLLNNKHVLF